MKRGGLLRERTLSLNKVRPIVRRRRSCLMMMDYLPVWIHGVLPEKGVCFYRVNVDHPQGDVGVCLEADIYSPALSTQSPAAAYHSSIICLRKWELDDRYQTGFRFDTHLYYLDTTHLRSGWKPLANIQGRISPSIAVVDNKVYITGFAKIGITNVLEGQIIDPQTGVQKSMAPRLVDSNHSLTFLTVIPDKKLLVFLDYPSACFYYYDLRLNDWFTVCDPVFSKKMEFLADRESYSVTAGTTIYWFCCNMQVYAYDFVYRVFYSSIGPIVDFDKLAYTEKPGKRSNAVLLHLWDDCFCLVRKDLPLNPNSDKAPLRCMKLSIIKLVPNYTHGTANTTPLFVSVLSTQTFFVDAQFELMGALLVNPTMGANMPVLRVNGR